MTRNFKTLDDMGDIKGKRAQKFVLREAEGGKTLKGG